MMPLRATYRLQLNKDFTFVDARAIVPYLADLGISHAYLSPILKAQPGSTHGYDTVDHGVINPELGGIDEFQRLAEALRAAGMGVLLDIVPNHMGVGGADNTIWLDVLKHGPEGRFADWFDIDWAPPRLDMRNRLLVPFLGESYAEALTAGHLLLKSEEDGFAVWANGHDKLPICERDEAALLARYGNPQAAVSALNGDAGAPESWRELDALIGHQHWRIAHFRTAADEINYRRFFINSELAGIRVERPDAFAHVHRLVLDLIAAGLVDGLRIDHIDGLADPKGYLDRLRSAVPRPIHLFVEKILAPHERLRADWPVEGSTGYEFGAQLTRVLTNPSGEAPLDRTYRGFVGAMRTPEDEAYHCKLRVMDNELAAELADLARRFFAIASSRTATQDLTENGLKTALREIIAHLAVYRTYGNDRGMPLRDRRELGRAVALARRHRPFHPPTAFTFLQQLLVGELDAPFDAGLVSEARRRFQQLTGPVMAKGVEDTALYRSNRLVSLNEVGADPGRFSMSMAAFHDANRQRLVAHPLALLATSTHDTKRGEDTRALISAIADHAGLWDNSIAQWRELLMPGSSEAIHPNDLYLFFQLAVGGWPLAGPVDDLGERITGAMTKAVREGRERSDWGAVNERYETALAEFVASALSNAEFLHSFEATRSAIAETGRRKALIQAVLKLTVPGVPDIYRGAEDWEQSFVDPDNRRPVDFSSFPKRLTEPTSPDDQKLVVTRKLLSLRKDHPDLFAQGSYEPLALGPTTLTFRRSFAGTEMVVVADLSKDHVVPDGAVASLVEAGYRDVQVFRQAAPPSMVLLKSS